MALKSLDFRKTTLSNTQLKKIIGSSFDKNDNSTWNTTTILLAQFGKNFAKENEKFDTRILWDAFYKTLNKSIVPFKVITLDCTDELREKIYYKENFCDLKYSKEKKLYTLLKLWQ